MPFATINGIKIHYQVQGSGPPLLMLAPGGFGSVMSRWTAAGVRRREIKWRSRAVNGGCARSVRGISATARLRADP